MPDSRARDPMPRDWGDAFAALPLATPPDAGWQRLAAALPPAQAPARPARWRRPALALVATVVMAAVVPMMSSQLLQRETAVPMGGGRTATVAPAHRDMPVAPDVLPTAAMVVTDADVPPAPAGKHLALAQHPVTPAGDTRLDALYDESARLEALLAQIPDSGAANAASLAVATGLQDQVTHIDVALSQPALSADTRAALWQERVDTLRQLTGVEATQRWNVAFADVAQAPDTAIY